jgi:hypothetical protein
MGLDGAFQTLIFGFGGRRCGFPKFVRALAGCVMELDEWNRDGEGF